MKMFDIDGKEVQVDVRQSSYPIRGTSKSATQALIGQILKKRFPYDVILEEFTIPGSRMKLDFFLPGRKICIESDGIQHDQHVPFFHGDRNTSKEYAYQKVRDTQKENWAIENNLKFIRIPDGADESTIRAAIK